MVQSQFSLSWETYKPSICNGFSALQQNGEFVDMTLAADGHFVKVHRVLMALVSPYLKELISSAPCQHPVLFLNNVTYKTLSCLLEYVYTGEVSVPAESLLSFVDTAKALHIKGLEDLDSSDTDTAYKVAEAAQSHESIHCNRSGIKRLAVPSEIGSGEIGLPVAAKRIMLKHQKPTKTSADNQPKRSLNISTASDHNTTYTEMLDTTDMQNDSDDDDGFDNHETHQSQEIQQLTPTSAPSTNLQYTISIRGSLQVILNRYIYNLHSSTNSGVRRWRCVDYRNIRCKAFIVTKESVVLNRANLHNHSFHDKKILQKIEKKAVFSALKDVEAYKEKELSAEKDAESSMEQQNYILDLPTLEVVDEQRDQKWDVSVLNKGSS